MGLKFLQDIVNLDNIQFVNSSGTNAGLINMDGNDLVLSNPLGDILLGDGASDVYIGDGANNVDILFEQSGSIKADDSASGVVLTLGSSNTTLAFGGNTSFAGIVTAISGTSANTVDVGTNGVPFKNIYAAHHVGGSSINYATSRGWVEDDAPLSSTQGGFYGGDFVRNGDADENAVVRGQDPFNNKALLWKCILHDTDDDADGGWNKNITIPANNNIGYLSYVYFMADFTPDSSTAGTRDGTVYLGCGTASGQTINISNNSSNTNPYFISHPLYTINNGGPVIAERWYLMIGVIQPYNDETTGNDTISGVYDVETGERVATGSEFKMGNNTTSQIHRAYVYYDESGDAGENVYFWNPGFHAIDGSEPKLQDLLKRQIYVLDNVKAAFGDSDDLQIYHDGSDSIIKDSGTGSLDIYSSHIHLKSAGGTNDLAQFFSGGHSYIYANNVLRIEATTSGVNITGDMAVSGTVDGIDIAARDAVLTSTTTTANAALPKTGGTMTGNLTINSTYPRIFLTDSDNNDDWSIINNDGKFGIYNDTDTSYALSIDGSNNVGIGTTSPSTVGGTAKMTIDVGTGTVKPVSIVNGTTDGMYIRRYDTNGQYQIQTTVGGGNTGNLSLQSYGGNVGIGTTSPSARLEVSSGSSYSSDLNILSVSGTKTGGTAVTNVKGINVDIGSNDHASGHDITNLYGAYINNNTSGGSATVINNWYGVYVPAVDADRVSNSVSAYFGDNVGIGTTSPSAKLEVNDGHVLIRTNTAGSALTWRESDDGNIAGQLRSYGNRGDIYLYSDGVKTTEISSSNDSFIPRIHIGGTNQASAALQVTGNIVVSGTVDGRDIATDGTKLDTIDTNADVTPSWVPSSDPSYLTSLPSHNHDDRYYTETESDARYAALSHNHAASAIVTGTLADGRISESSVTQHEAALTITEGQLPDDMPSDKVKQICTTHHNFFMNSSSTSADFFVPFNNLNESSNPTNAQYYNRMVAPYNGRIVKVVLHTTAAIGTSCQVLFWVATSAGVFAPSAAETVTGVNLNAANTSATATFSTNSTAQFSAEDVLGVSIIKSSSSTANMQVTVVWEYTL